MSNVIKRFHNTPGLGLTSRGHDKDLNLDTSLLSSEIFQLVWLSE